MPTHHAYNEALRQRDEAVAEVARLKEEHARLREALAGLVDRIAHVRAAVPHGLSGRRGTVGTQPQRLRESCDGAYRALVSLESHARTLVAASDNAYASPSGEGA